MGKTLNPCSYLIAFVDDPKARTVPRLLGIASFEDVSKAALWDTMWGRTKIAFPELGDDSPSLEALHARAAQYRAGVAVTGPHICVSGPIYRDREGVADMLVREGRTMGDILAESEAEGRRGASKSA